MAEKSLADRAVDALAHVGRMTDSVTNDHPERHAIREMKQMAESILEEAFRQARRLAFTAESLQESMRKEVKHEG